MDRVQTGSGVTTRQDVVCYGWTRRTRKSPEWTVKCSFLVAEWTHIPTATLRNPFENAWWSGVHILLTVCVCKKFETCFEYFFYTPPYCSVISFKAYNISESWSMNDSVKLIREGAWGRVRNASADLLVHPGRCFTFAFFCSSSSTLARLRLGCPCSTWATPSWAAGYSAYRTPWPTRASPCLCEYHSLSVVLMVLDYNPRAWTRGSRLWSITDQISSKSKEHTEYF